MEEMTEQEFEALNDLFPGGDIGPDYEFRCTARRWFRSIENSCVGREILGLGVYYDSRFVYCVVRTMHLAEDSVDSRYIFTSNESYNRTGFNRMSSTGRNLCFRIKSGEKVSEQKMN